MRNYQLKRTDHRTWPQPITTLTRPSASTPDPPTTTRRSPRLQSATTNSQGRWTGGKLKSTKATVGLGIDDFDSVANEQQARLATVLFRAGYVVTPDPQRAGGHERVLQEIPVPLSSEKLAVVLFYVEPAAFGRYASELPALYEEIGPGVHDARAVSTLARYEVIGFLLDRVVGSGQLTSYERGMLKR